MREMQGAEDEPEGSLPEVNDQGRVLKATLQIVRFDTPSLDSLECAGFNPLRIRRML